MVVRVRFTSNGRVFETDPPRIHAGRDDHWDGRDGRWDSIGADWMLLLGPVSVSLDTDVYYVDTLPVVVEAETVLMVIVSTLPFIFGDDLSRTCSESNRSSGRVAL